VAVGFFPSVPSRVNLVQELYLIFDDLNEVATNKYVLTTSTAALINAPQQLVVAINLISHE